MTDAEVAPGALELEGEPDLAVQVRQDEAADWAAAKEAENRAIAAANDAHVRRMAAEQDRRREEARTHYGDGGT